MVLRRPVARGSAIGTRRLILPSPLSSTSCCRPTPANLDFLAGRSPDRFTGEDIAQELVLPRGKYSVAGTLSSVGFACKKVGRPHPFVFSSNSDGGDGVVPHDEVMAALFTMYRDLHVLTSPLPAHRATPRRLRSSSGTE